MRIQEMNLLWCRLIPVLFFWPLLNSLAGQQAVSFESLGPKRTIYEGSRFEVSFTLKNETAKRFIPPSFDGFRVTSGPSEMRGAGFVNGKSYSHQSWSYELEAGSPGKYTIGPATVQTDQKTLRTRPITIRVAKGGRGRDKIPPGSDDQVFISSELERQTAWVGQQVYYQVKLYTQLSISNYDILDLPQFNGFFAQERQRFDTRTKYETIKGKKYAVRILYEMALFPQQAGTLQIGTARVRLGVEKPGNFSSLLGSTPVLVQTQPLSLEVKPLPEPAPEQFSGGVGHYEWLVTADKDTLSTDDALTLSVKIEGNGDARQFANPGFTLPAGLEGFDPKVVEQEEYETGDQMVHARNLEYVILPREPGNYRFSPELIVFDPDSNQYSRLITQQEVVLHVTAGQYYGTEDTAADTIAGPAPLRPGFLEKTWNALSEAGQSSLFWTFLVAIAVLIGGFFAWKRRQQTRSESPPKTKPVVKTAKSRLTEARRLLQSEDVRGFYLELRKAIQTEVGQLIGIEPTLVTLDTVQQQLSEYGAAAQTVDALVQVWQQCEQAVFAQAAGLDRTKDFQQTEAALKELDRVLKKH